MALTVGTDTYIGLADANTYLSAHHLSNDPALVAWNALSDDDNEVLLRQAASIIDKQPLVGFRVGLTQALEFPRYLYTDDRTYQTNLRPVYDFYGTTVQYVGDNLFMQTAVPQSVKDAQCEIAVELALGVNPRVEMQRNGVKSFSVPGLSETYTGGFNKIVSDRARELLAPYLGGGFDIC